MQSYIARNLEYEARNEEGTPETIILEDSQLLDIAQSKPIVILADAGMGKTELIKELAKPSHIKTKYLSASDLVQKSVKRLSIQPDETLLIDAFDEIPSTKDSSGIDSVLNRLAELNYPKFILTCRSIEWNNSNKNEIQSDYTDILTVTLTNLSREDAQQFLQSRGLASENVSQLITQLEENSLSSFYENPRNLALLAEIDFSVHPVPKTKAKLFKLATQKLWQEVNPRETNVLRHFEQEQIVECAGLLFANYLLVGKQYLYKGIPANTPEDAVNIYSLSTLIDREVLEATIQSRLFQSMDNQLFRPWHRSIAEYLGAKWLAKAMSKPMVKRHIFSYLVIDNGVIASLRGIFAWLPTFNPNLSEIVIKTDPYGLIEYGDTTYFSDMDSMLLFDALEKLTIKDPWFRKNNNWKDAKAEGLVRYSLLDRYKQILSDKSINSHFLKTILDILKDADFVSKVSDELFSITYNDDWYYFARFDALLLLAKNNLVNTTDFNTIISVGSFDSLRLFFEYTKQCGFELLTDEQVVRAIIKSYKFKRPNEIKNSEFFPKNGSEYYFLDYPDSRIIKLLNRISDAIKNLNINKSDLNYDTAQSINSLIIALIRRYIEQNSSPLDSSVFYRSINIFDNFKSQSIADNNSKFFTDYFEKYPEQKLEIQQLFLEHSYADIIFYRLKSSVLRSIYPNSTDIKKLLNIIQKQLINKENIKKWEIILNLARTKDGLNDDIYILALPYAKRSKKRLVYLEDNRKAVESSVWELDRIQEEESREQEDKERHAKYREFLSQHISQLEAGNLQYCVTVAEALLDDHRDIPKELKPLDKLEHYLGKTLTESAIKGFKSSLHTTFPTAKDIVDLRILQNKVYRSESVLMAGIYCLLADREKLNNLTDEIILSATVIYELSSYSHLELNIDLGHAIQEQVIERNLKNEVVNILVKPQFKAKTEVIYGWHLLESYNDNFMIETLTTLISDYEYANNHHLHRLISVLALHKALHNLEAITKAEINNKDFGNYDKSKQSIWLALYSYFYNQDFLNLINSFTGLKTEVFSEIENLYKTVNIQLPLSISSWIVKEYSNLYPDNNIPFSNAEFIKKCLLNVSSNLSYEAQQRLSELKESAGSSYRVFITDLLYEQANNIRDANYQAPMLADLLNVFQNKAPLRCKDLKTLVLELLDEIQSKVKSSELDSYKMFYEDGKNKNPKKPHGENYCRDRLADLLKPYIEPYQFRLDTEKDMPDDKRADLTCSKGEMQLPIEVKGQWHDDLWTAMNDQLGDLYLKEYQSQGQGIYLIFYFGENTTKNPKRNDEYKPQNALQLQECLTACIEEKYKQGIDVFVIDLSIEAT